MEEQKKSFIKWVRSHKKELIIAGISVAGVIAAVCCYRNRDSIAALWKSLKKSINKRPLVQSQKKASGKGISIIPPEAANTIEVVTETSSPVLRVVPQYPIEVSSHKRNLPKGRNASARKIATAAEHGHELLPGQTWVESYTKHGTAA